MASAFNRVVLNWTDNSATETGFRVLRSTDGVTFAEVGNVPSNTTTFTDTSVLGNTNYHCRIIAFNTVGDSSVAGPVSVTTPVVPGAGPGAGPGVGRSGTGGGSGGGGGGEVTTPSTTTVSAAGFSGDLISLDTSGKTTRGARLQSPSARVAVSIPAGTNMKARDGAPLGALSVAPVASPPPAPAGQAVLVAQEFGPPGATFSPPITMTFSFAELTPPVPPGAKLVIAFRDNDRWVPLESTVDPVARTVSAPVSHFTIFALLTVLPSPTPKPEAPSHLGQKPTPGPPAQQLAPTPTPAMPVAPTPTMVPTMPPAPLEPPQPPVMPVQQAPPGPNWLLLAGIMAAVLLAATVFYWIFLRVPREQE